jgi:hypothetical protein
MEPALKLIQKPFSTSASISMREKEYKISMQYMPENSNMGYEIVGLAVNGNDNP